MKQSILYLRLGLAAGLLLVEVMILSLLVDASTLPENGLLSVLLAKGGTILRWMIVTAGLLVLFLAKEFHQRLGVLLFSHSTKEAIIGLVIHFVVFVGFSITTLFVFRPQVITPQYIHYLWLMTAGLTGISWCFIIAGRKNWQAFIVAEKRSIAGALLGGLLVVALGFHFQQFWGSMTEFTLRSTKTLLELLYDEIVFDPSRRNLGVNAFWVNIAPVCSGIEGAVLAVSIATIYLYLSRQYLKLPHALVLLPLAAIISVALNIIRITALIILGAEISPALAIGGFHSVAGWIAAILVALLIVFVFSHWKWIQRAPEHSHSAPTKHTDTDLAQAILIPFVAFTGTTLISGIFTSEFDYYYPIKVVLTFSVILYFWKVYDFHKPDKILEAIVVGAVVTVLWVLMIPVDEQVNINVLSAISGMSFWAFIGWCIFRLLGFWILAPILEELVFRSYLLSRLAGQEISNMRKPAFSLLALVVSSVLFGLLHNAWLAGTVAGLLFAYVRYRSNSITSCIVSHSTANVLVASWAVYSDNWALI